ncbi:M23 family metallopeptidase [Aquitalea sp.]|uniref:M23 family metallopeptidase n=1 Tax=Aquitalea sp. TaxID=1872623 RepID=UPI0025825E79|nr:M23 family metallopeptidase [Aquitalea sp.]
MLIGPPVLLKPAQAQATTQKEDRAWLESMMPNRDRGGFPVGKSGQWHPGLHITGFVGSGDNNAVWAIADGAVMYYAEDKGTDLSEHANSNGLVVIRHETQIGSEAEGCIVYYSCYQHLQVINDAIKTAYAKGSPVYRKDLIGHVGNVADNSGIHFEIFCSGANVKKITGRSTGKLNLAKSGRKNIVYGDTHYYIPAGTPLYFQATAPDYSASTLKNPIPSTTDLYVTIKFEKGEVTISSKLLQDNQYISIPHSVKDSKFYQAYEYKLYDRAVKMGEQYKKIAPSAIYEMLKFGRIIDEVNTQKIGHDIPHWHQIDTPQGLAWVNLNAAPAQGAKPITVFSDGDFPDWADWTLIDDDPVDNGLCDSKIIHSLLYPAGSERNVAALQRALTDPAVSSKLSKMICKIPSEWDKAKKAVRQQWRKVASPLNPIPLDNSKFQKLMDDLDKACFWQRFVDNNNKSPSACLPTVDNASKAFYQGAITEDVWFFNPREFILHFRKCNWLSEFEFAQSIPRERKHLNKTEFLDIKTSWNNAFQLATEWAKIINASLKKYGISDTRPRLFHFLSQSIPETDNFKLMAEINGPDAKYAPWYGRGIIQLTLKETYEKYGNFIKFPPSNYIPPIFENLTWNPDVEIAKYNGWRVPMSVNKFGCADSGGFYMAMRNGHRLLDRGFSINDCIEISKLVNGDVSLQNLNGLDGRLSSLVYELWIFNDYLIPQTDYMLEFDWRKSSKKEKHTDQKTGKERERFVLTHHSIPIRPVMQRM